MYSHILARTTYRLFNDKESSAAVALTCPQAYDDAECKRAFFHYTHFVYTVVIVQDAGFESLIDWLLRVRER